MRLSKIDQSTQPQPGSTVKSLLWLAPSVFSLLILAVLPSPVALAATLIAIAVVFPAVRRNPRVGYMLATWSLLTIFCLVFT